MNKEKWILDTDIGNDQDDCMALGYVLSRADIDLLGITTVSGQSYKRALFADTICGLAGRTIAIHKGNETSLSGTCIQHVMGESQARQIERYPHRDLRDVNDAVLFMKQQIEKNPNQVVLACIGQLTNVALLFATFPHIPALLKSLVIMGGRFEEDPAFDTKKWGVVEWNIKCDPHAAKIVFDANVKALYISGIEHTHKFRKDAKKASERLLAIPFMHPVSDAIRDKADLWFHDPVAIWAYLNKDQVAWKKGTAVCDVLNPNMGMTHFVPNENGTHYALADISVARFFESYARDMGFSWD